jgi:hypothetical protein
MADPGRLPIRVRIGDSREYEIGSLDMAREPGESTVRLAHTRMAGLLRAAADAIDPPTADPPAT